MFQSFYILLWRSSSSAGCGEVLNSFDSMTPLKRLNIFPDFLDVPFGSYGYWIYSALKADYQLVDKFPDSFLVSVLCIFAQIISEEMLCFYYVFSIRFWECGCLLMQ